MKLIPGRLYLLLNENLNFWKYGANFPFSKHFDFNTPFLYIGSPSGDSVFLGPDSIRYACFPADDGQFEEAPGGAHTKS